MSSADVTMTDVSPAATAAAAVADPSSAAPSAAAAPFTFHCTQLPSSGTLHLAYLRDLSADQLKQLKAQSGDGKEFAVINANHVSS
jgi:zona occludens toxin (predicted ATPase)